MNGAVFLCPATTRVSRKLVLKPKGSPELMTAEIFPVLSRNLLLDFANELLVVDMCALGVDGEVIFFLAGN